MSGERAGIDGATVADVVDVLLPAFGSGVAEAMVAVFFSVEPMAAVLPMLRTTVKFALAPPITVAVVQVIVPVIPTAGVMQFHPAGAVIDVNVRSAGNMSFIETDCASLGPLFVTLIV